MEEGGKGGVGGRIRFFWKGKEGKGGGGGWSQQILVLISALDYIRLKIQDA